MATTFRQLLNRALVTLGEDEIAMSTATLSDSYNRLLAEMANQIKEEIEDAHNWRALREDHSATVLADALSGAVVGATERSRLVRIQEVNSGRLTPLVFDVTDASDPDPIREMDMAKLIFRDQIDPDERTATSPVWFALNNDEEDALSIYVNQRPSTSRTITVVMTTPQARLADDDLDTNIDIPIRPLLMGTLWYAFEERGEELGPNTRFTEERFRSALNDAIARDSAEQGDIVELVPV